MLRRLVSFVVICVGVLMLSLTSDGFRAFTTEGARRLQITETPRVLPAVRMTDMLGRSVSLQDYHGKLLLVDFIYTWCPDICYAMGSSLEAVRTALHARGLMKDVVILSVSFDPARDDVAALQDYAGRFGADGQSWNVTVVPDGSELTQLLAAFDVRVLPLADGGFEHNGAVHLVSRDGKLFKILDFNVPQSVVRAVEASL